jgi:hypothetical protein
MGKQLFVALSIALACTCIAHAEDFPSSSGMAVLDSTHVLLIDDTKDKPELAERPRLRVATLVPGGTTIEPVVEDWGDGPKPNDLEAIAPIPGQPGRYLICESGYIGDKYGRIFYVEITRDPSSASWSSHVFGKAQLPAGLLHSDLEAIALGAKSSGGLTLVLSERGGSGPYSPAWLWWGDFDLGTGTFTRTEEQMYGMQLMWPNKTYFPGARPCTDLYLDAGGFLWASGAEDMGDSGPFRSVIYRVGKFDPSVSYPVQYEMNQDMVWYLDGLKVEALGPPVVAGSVLTFATDDENYGGLWRPLPPADPQPQRQPYYYGD